VLEIADAKTATLTLSARQSYEEHVHGALSQNDRVHFDTKGSDGVTLKIDRSATFKGEFDIRSQHAAEVQRCARAILEQRQGRLIGIDQTGTARLPLAAPAPHRRRSNRSSRTP
jgi:hypothetical protein